MGAADWQSGLKKYYPNETSAQNPPLLLSSYPQIFNFQFPDKSGFTLRYNRFAQVQV
jgi:hypothetical protein